MRGFIPLLKLSFKSLLLTTINTGRRGKREHKKAVSGAGALLILCAVMVYISGTYSFGMASLFAKLGGLDVMMLAMVLFAAVFPFIFIVFGSQSLVFSTKDVDLVLSLPVSAFSIMLARVLALYLEALLMCELLLVPAGVAFIMNEGTANPAGFMVLLVVAGLFIALLPTTLSLLFGSLISLVVSKLRFKNLLNVLFSVVLLVGIMALSLGFSFTMGNAESGALDIGAMRDAIAGAVPPAVWAVQGMLGNVLSLLALAALCLVPFLLITWVFSLFYKRILTSLSSHHLKTNYKLGRVKATGSFAALFAKEARKFFGTPAYVLNGGIGILLAVVACGAAVVFKNDLQVFLGSLAAAGLGELLTRYLPAILLAGLIFMGSMTYVSCVSISLEGKTLWILKEAPLGVRKVFTAKAGFNFLLGAFTVLVCVPLLAFAFALPLASAAVMALVGLLFSLLTSVSGLFINLLFPRMDAENDTAVIKQSTSVIITMLLGFAVLALLVGLFFLLDRFAPGFLLFGAAATVLLAGLNALCIALLATKGKKLFGAL